MSSISQFVNYLYCWIYMNLYEKNYSRTRLAFGSFWNLKSLCFNCSHLFSFAVSLAVISFHSLYFVVTRCHSLSLIVIHCDWLSLVVIHCTTRCHSLSLVATRCTTCCHLLYHWLSLAVTRWHLLPFDLTLVSPFINDLPKITFSKKKNKKKTNS